MSTSVYDAGVYSPGEATFGTGPEYLIVDMRLEEEEEADVDEIEDLKKRQREAWDEQTSPRREPDQNAEERKPS